MVNAIDLFWFLFWVGMGVLGAFIGNAYWGTAGGFSGFFIGAGGTLGILLLLGWWGEVTENKALSKPNMFVCPCGNGYYDLLPREDSTLECDCGRCYRIDNNRVVEC